MEKLTPEDPQGLGQSHTGNKHMSQGWQPGSADGRCSGKAQCCVPALPRSGFGCGEPQHLATCEVPDYRCVLHSPQRTWEPLPPAVSASQGAARGCGGTGMHPARCRSAFQNTGTSLALLGDSRAVAVVREGAEPSARLQLLEVDLLQREARG